MATLRQKKVVNKISEIIRNKDIKSKGELLRESGYSEQTSKRPSQVFESKGIQEELKPFLKRLEAHRNRIMSELELKDLSEEKFKDLTDALVKTTHDLQLLSGGDTEKVKQVTTINYIIPE